MSSQNQPEKDLNHKDSHFPEEKQTGNLSHTGKEAYTDTDAQGAVGAEPEPQTGEASEKSKYSKCYFYLAYAAIFTIVIFKTIGAHSARNMLATFVLYFGALGGCATLAVALGADKSIGKRKFSKRVGYVMQALFHISLLHWTLSEKRRLSTTSAGSDSDTVVKVLWSMPLDAPSGSKPTCVDSTFTVAASELNH
ncbi:hypothetical protein KGF57_000875 [Candida theae]|uniref:Uncharacterized protein n=1 Tax=Candida theae TaxID=1198502 RepID=A0AAD5G089_9ASCO|nr:uncharacterized protein KGF57_000875 [Candida theae]KAI5965082.1 hypothetical protein KGF57_000875 [Candida theae]